MQQAGVEPSNRTYVSLISACGAEGELGQACVPLAGGALPADETLCPPCPGARRARWLTHDYCIHCARRPTRMEYFHLLREREGGRVPEQAFAALMNVCRLARQHRMADEVLGLMQQTGMTPSMVTLTPLIITFLEAGEFERGREVRSLRPLCCKGGGGGGIALTARRPASRVHAQDVGPAEPPPGVHLPAGAPGAQHARQAA